MLLPPTNPFRLPEKRFAAIVFADLCGSTEAGERLANTRDLFELLDRWQRLAAFDFCNYGGKIGASDSDMVMGYFVGSETADYAISRALLSAVRIRNDTLQFAQRCNVPLNVHIGLHYGDAEIGAIGPPQRMNLTTIGPNVNIAARLESKANKGEIFISKTTLQQALVLWHGECVGPRDLKGVSHSVQCFSIKHAGLSSKNSDELEPLDLVAAVLEAEALEETGRDQDALELARRVVRCSNGPEGLSPKQLITAREICIRGLLVCREPEEALIQIEELAASAEKLEEVKALARASFYRAQALMQRSKFADAIGAFSFAKSGFETHGSERDVGDALYYAGVCHEWLRNRGQALNLYTRAKQHYNRFINNQEASPLEIGKACLELSLLLSNEPRSASEVLARAQKLFLETCQFRHLVTVFLNMSCVANRMLLHTDAENYARRALELAIDFDPIDGVGFAYGNIAVAMENRRDFDQARAYYEKALNVAELACDDFRCDQMRANISRIAARA